VRTVSILKSWVGASRHLSPRWQMVTLLSSTAALVLPPSPPPGAAPENEHEPSPEPDRYGGDVDFKVVVSRLPGHKGPDLLDQIRRVKQKRGGNA
jgi:hypothetical protein